MTEQMPPKRVYRMSRRAESAAQTEQLIFSAAAELWQAMPINEITLDMIAEKADVSVRTVIRRYGSKEQLFEACIQNQVSNTSLQRDDATPGDISSAVECLLRDYEAYGEAMLKTLATEEQFAESKKITQAGRRYHRQWCARMFADFLPDKDDAGYKKMLSAFYAATDLYLWKLLRLDLRHSRKDVQEIVIRILEGLAPRQQNS